MTGCAAVDVNSLGRGTRESERGDEKGKQKEKNNNDEMIR